MPNEGRCRIVQRDMEKRGYKLKYESKKKMFVFYGRSPHKLMMAMKSAWEWDYLRYSSEVLWSKKCIKKKLIPIYSVVDGEGDITYYRLMIPFFKGSNSDIYKCNIEGRFEDRWFVVDKGDLNYLKGYHYGDDKGDMYVISLPEAYHLYKVGVLKLKKEQKDVLKDDFLRITGEVFSYLRSHGLVVKTGFKYGSHFRAYENNPINTHAEYLVQCVMPGNSERWEIISRAVRVAHGVRKEMIYAIVPKRGEIKFLKIGRVKM